MANYNKTTVQITIPYPRQIGQFVFLKDGRFKPTENWIDKKSKQEHDNIFTKI